MAATAKINNNKKGDRMKRGCGAALGFVEKYDPAR